MLCGCQTAIASALSVMNETIHHGFEVFWLRTCCNCFIYLVSSDIIYTAFTLLLWDICDPTCTLVRSTVVGCWLWLSLCHRSRSTPCLVLDRASRIEDPTTETPGVRPRIMISWIKGPDTHQRLRNRLVSYGRIDVEPFEALARDPFLRKGVNHDAR